MHFMIAFFNIAIGGHNIYIEQQLVYKVGINFIWKLLNVLYRLK